MLLPLPRLRLASSSGVCATVGGVGAGGVFMVGGLKMSLIMLIFVFLY